MKICMMTNTYLPHVGGVARSVSTFAQEYRRNKHQVLVVAPEYEGDTLPKRAENMVTRVAAIQNFNGSDFSVRLPLATSLSERLEDFKADIIHAHHPFLLGDTALRIASTKNVPVVFTHHTRYEDYTHYVPFDSPMMKDFAIKLSTEYANLCGGVIAPSESIAKLIKQRGVTVPIKVVPTGIEVEAFAAGRGSRFRRKFKIPSKAFVVGHVGRLAPEKNLGYLARAVARFVKQTPEARFLVVGGGPSEELLTKTFSKAGISDRLILAGKHTGGDLADAYKAMNIFAFASMSETQGMVLAEAMAAGCPVVALNAPGVREVMRHEKNGLMLPARSSAKRFAEALKQLHDDRKCLRAYSRAARKTSMEFSREHCAELALDFYREIRKSTRRNRLMINRKNWGSLLERLGTEWKLVAEKIQVLTNSFIA